jgi:hypothetical protein
LLAAIILEYVRSDQQLALQWADVDAVAYVAKKKRLCLVYHLPDKTGRIKHYSLATSIGDEEYQIFSESFEANAPPSVERVTPRGLSSTFANATGWSLLTGWLVMLTVIGVLYLVGAIYH